MEGNTRPFTVFKDADLMAAFAGHGFRASGRDPQFFLPMDLHRALGLAPLSRALEATGPRWASGGPLARPSS